MDNRILVDADACPVKREILQIARKYDLNVLMVCHVGIALQPKDGLEIIKVDRAPNQADFAIINRAKSGDIVVTGDWGLASLLTRRKINVIGPRGYIYEETHMDLLLQIRAERQAALRAGKRIKGPKPFRIRDHQRFIKNLNELIKKIKFS